MAVASARGAAAGTRGRAGSRRSSGR